MMSVGARSWQAVKPHIPLIKFRKGGKDTGEAGNHKQSSQAQGLNLSSSKASSHTGTIIDDTELPSRYFRKPLSQVEIETIERGGPE
ncbi:alpha-ketoglutarate dehydrogenase component 4-like [Uloborus diversus]|uniref:alpha-ketoglutarate dehydrogenase component 4-like n=1 Tax=Uloborus diversus TaxID=327109 RepID=UPI002409941A|nr:alpha-ketoglutarate dehydrogenase component 4-like [Uloborus diversus]